MSARDGQANARTNHVLAGILSLVGGIFVFSIQDVIVKAINGGYSVTEIVLVRSLVSIPILAVIIVWQSGFAGLVPRQLGLNILRGFVLFLAYTTSRPQRFWKHLRRRRPKC